MYNGGVKRERCRSDCGVIFDRSYCVKFIDQIFVLKMRITVAIPERLNVKNCQLLDFATFV